MYEKGKLSERVGRKTMDPKHSCHDRQAAEKIRSGSNTAFFIDNTKRFKQQNILGGQVNGLRSQKHYLKR